MTKLSPRIPFAIGLLSVANIAFQLSLMQILSLVQWHYFAYMVISMGLLGFGAAGTCIALFRTWMLDRFTWIVPVAMILAGLSMGLVVPLSQMPSVRFDTMLLFADPTQLWRLLLTYLLFFLPFFGSALAIGLVYVKYVQHIGQLYFADLFGSGMGGLLVLGLFWWFVPQQLPAVIAVLPVIAGFILIPKAHIRYGILAIAAMLLITMNIYVPTLHMSQFKSLQKTLDLPEVEITHTRRSPFGLMQVVASPVLRYAPGLSLNYQQEVPVRKAIFNNGNWFGPVIGRNEEDTATVLDYTTAALPYRMQSREKVLVLNAGTFEDVLQAITQKAGLATAVEPNTVATGLLSNELASETDSLLLHPAVQVHHRSARNYLMLDTIRYDLITLPMIDAFGGMAGLNALQEQYTLTQEAFTQMWHLLSPTGVISVSTWMDYPFRNPLKVLATLVEMLEAQGIQYPERHIASVRSWGTITFCAKKTPLTEEEIQKIRSFCEEMSFDPVILPHLQAEERSAFNALQDSSFFSYVDQILSPQRAAFYQDYDFNIRPATDNRPYFSQFFRWSSFFKLQEIFGSQAVPLYEIGYLVVIITLVQVVIAAILLIVLPLFRIGWRGGHKGWTLLYFSGLGLGYMFVEIVLIQRFHLYLGHPIYAVSAVISTLLVCSGIGSFLSSRLSPDRKKLWALTLIIGVLLLVYAFGLTPVLQSTIAFPWVVKIPLAFLLIALPAVLMGLPFPLGLRWLSVQNELQAPWAWGVNACLSVISAVLAMVITVEWGFMGVMILAALAYLMAFLVSVLSHFE